MIPSTLKVPTIFWFRISSCCQKLEIVMPTYVTPGVYIEEIPKTQSSISGVETAVPVFIGFTEKTKDENNHSLVNLPTGLNSLHEFEEIFGNAQDPEIEVNVKQARQEESGPIIVTKVRFSVELGNDKDFFPNRFLHYAMQMYFSNGGGPCFVVSIGDYSKNVDPELFIHVFSELESFDEPTLLVFPDACLCNGNGYGNVSNAALAHCKKMGDRFAIIDVPNAVPAGTSNNVEVTNDFRDKITTHLNHLKYGAAYFPYLRTRIPISLNDGRITIRKHQVLPSMSGGACMLGEEGIFEGRKLSGKDATGTYYKEKDPVTYNEVKNFLHNVKVILPPSAAVAGAYVRVDASRGVWKAPANVSLNTVTEPAIQITDHLGQELNVDTASGKSVNAIRTFRGQGYADLGCADIGR